MNNPLPDPLRPEGSGYLPGLAIDIVIFGFHENELKILLLEYHNTRLFALPGGFIQDTEDLDEAARRILFDRTGLRDIYLEQFATFGDYARYDPAPLREILVARGITPQDDHWLLKRFVSVGYYALVDFTKAVPAPDELADRCTWHDIVDHPPLMLDHASIVEKGLDTLRSNLDRKLIGFNLMPETFTMADLQRLYETVLGHPLHRTSFQRKMLGLGILERIDKKWTGKAHKAPYLYRFASGSSGTSQ